MKTTDINGAPLVPGQLYVCLLRDIDYEGNPVEEYGSLVYYGSDGVLYCGDYDGDDGTDPDFDDLIPQNAPINSEFIFD